MSFFISITSPTSPSISGKFTAVSANAKSYFSSVMYNLHFVIISVTAVSYHTASLYSIIFITSENKKIGTHIKTDA